MYLVFWLAACISFLWGIWFFKLLPMNIIGITTLFLLILTLSLNCFSYYSCIVYTCFLASISRLKVGTLKHNKYLPSSSWGLQRLMSNAKVFSMIFLLVSFLYTLQYVAHIIPSIQNTVSMSLFHAHPLAFGLISLLVFLLGLATFLVIFITPKYFLRRIFRKWKELSLREFEAKLYERDSGEEDYELRERIVHDIEMLNNDKLAFESNTFEVSVAVTTIAVNVLTSIGFFVKSNPL